MKNSIRPNRITPKRPQSSTAAAGSDSHWYTKVTNKTKNIAANRVKMTPTIALIAPRKVLRSRLKTDFSSRLSPSRRRNLPCRQSLRINGMFRRKRIAAAGVRTKKATLTASRSGNLRFSLSASSRNTAKSRTTNRATAQLKRRKRKSSLRDGRNACCSRSSTSIAVRSRRSSRAKLSFISLPDPLSPVPSQPTIGSTLASSKEAGEPAA